MKKIIMVILGFIVTACGGGGGGASTNTVTEAPAGIYSGAVNANGGSAETARTIITTDNRIVIVDIDTLEVIIGTISNNSITGTAYSSSVVPVTGKVTTVAGNNISGTYTTSLGDGRFSLVADPNLYARGASLSKLNGVWVDSVFVSGTGTTTWVIQSDGSFTMTSTSGCNATGQFSLIDSSKNEYDISLTVTNCLSYNGTYSGIGALSDTFNTDDTLSFIFNNGSLGGLFEPIKQ